jgi:putative aldouronate transport system substrate-binding protein
MRKIKKTVSVLVIMGIIAMTLGGFTTTKASTAKGVTLPLVPITIYVAGDRPKQQDAVLRYIEQQTKNELNIKLTVNYIPWGDYVNQVKLKAAAGENFDIFLTFFSELPGNISRKQALDITDLVKKYGADLKKAIPAGLWASVTVNGKIYGIPSVYPMTGMGRGFLLRKDLRLKYGLPEVTDTKSLENYLAAVKKNDPDMIPFLGTSFGMLAYDKANISHYYYNFGGGDLANTMGIDVTKTPYKVVNTATTDLTKWQWKESQKAMENGWFEKDILTDTDRDGKFIQGKAAAMGGDLFNINDRQNALVKNVPTGVVELAIINKNGPWYGTDPCNNFGAISTTSKHPDRAVMFMNWLRKNPTNWNMYMLGKPGLTYNMKGDKAEVPAGTDPSDKFAPTPWFMQQTDYAKYWTTDSKGYVDALNFWNKLKPIASPLSSFVYTDANVLAEETAVSKVVKEQGKLLEAGLITSDADKQKYLSDLDDAGLPAIIKDAQKQIDDFMKTHK